MPEASLNETKPANGQPVDKVYRSRTMRVLAPIWALLMLGNLIWAIAGNGRAVVSASILLSGAVLGLVRVRWPKDTWPTWVFSYEP